MTLERLEVVQHLGLQAWQGDLQFTRGGTELGILVNYSGQRRNNGLTQLDPFEPGGLRASAELQQRLPGFLDLLNTRQGQPDGLSV